MITWYDVYDVDMFGNVLRLYKNAEGYFHWRKVA